MGMFSKSSKYDPAQTAAEQDRLRRQTEAQAAVRRARAQAGRDNAAKQGRK